MRWPQIKCVGILTLTLLLTGCVTHELQSELSEQDAQEIVVLLKDNGIDAFAARSVGEKKGEEKWTVSIRGGDQNLARAWRVLEENGLPRQKDKGLEDVFANPGMIPTATEEKARLLVGISGEISRTLKSIAGIVDARVLVVLPENSPLLDKSEIAPPTASVLIKYRGNDVPLNADDVKTLVARAVEGLHPENVGVVYKRIEPAQSQGRMLIPMLGNQELLLIALLLLGLACIGLLVLIGSNRIQRSKLQKLQLELTAAVQTNSSAQLVKTPAA